VLPVKRKSLIVAALAGLSLAVPAQAQRVWRDGQWVQRGASAPVQYPARSVPQTRINPPQGGGWTRGGPQGGGQMRGGPIAGGRWGTKIGGRWHAGMQAPGGWSAYRRPVRGWTLPSYWMGGSYFLSDWTNWGLTSPPHGYFWVRYYDDAVLVDRGGRVWDSVRGVDWDRGAGGDAYAYADDGYAYAEARAMPRPMMPTRIITGRRRSRPSHTRGGMRRRRAMARRRRPPGVIPGAIRAAMPRAAAMRAAAIMSRHRSRPW
jgi:Ni/Co efflux regulator RcnB